MEHRMATQAVHAGREDLVRMGVHVAPIDLSSTYPTPDPALAGASLDALVAGAAEAPNPVYARLHNPTVARFERALATLEGAEQAVAFSSGMAALTAVLLPRGIWQARQGLVQAHRNTMRRLFYGACVLAGAFTLLPGRFLGDLVWKQGLGLMA